MRHSFRHDAIIKRLGWIVLLGVLLLQGCLRASSDGGEPWHLTDDAGSSDALAPADADPDTSAPAPTNACGVISPHDQGFQQIGPQRWQRHFESFSHGCGEYQFSITIDFGGDTPSATWTESICNSCNLPMLVDLKAFTSSQPQPSDGAEIVDAQSSGSLPVVASRISDSGGRSYIVGCNGLFFSRDDIYRYAGDFLRVRLDAQSSLQNETKRPIIELLMTTDVRHTGMGVTYDPIDALDPGLELEMLWPVLRESSAAHDPSSVLHLATFCDRVGFPFSATIPLDESAFAIQSVGPLELPDQVLELFGDH